MKYLVITNENGLVQIDLCDTNDELKELYRNQLAFHSGPGSVHADVYACLIIASNVEPKFKMPRYVPCKMGEEIDVPEGL